MEPRLVNSFPYEVMFEKKDMMERLEIIVSWGHYEIRVLRFHLTSFDAGRFIDFHNHAEFEFHFIPRGKGAVILEDTPYSLAEGMFYLTGPGVMHYQEASPEEAMDELCLHVDIVPRFKSDVDPWEAAEAEECIEKLRHFPLKPTQDTHHAMHCFLEAYEAADMKYRGFYTSIKQSVISILLKAARAWDSGDTGAEAPIRDMLEHRYHYAIQYIEANYTNNLTLDNVAEKLNISARQLQRVFRSMDENRPFSKIVEDIRLRAVCRRLEESSMPIEQVAQTEGFSNATYLHSVFRRRFGMTPAAYRKSKQAIN
nr:MULTISPECIES: helix-turn-helix domain-containing protein [Paenibacillus]